MLIQAELLASEKKLGKYVHRIAEEQETIQNNLKLWEKLIDQKVTMTELIELANLDDILERMLKKRIYSKEQEVLEYVTQARALVQSTVRD